MKYIVHVKGHTVDEVYGANTLEKAKAILEREQMLADGFDSISVTLKKKR